MSENLKVPRQEDVDWVKENVLDKLVKDKTLWCMKGTNVTILFDKVNKTFVPKQLSSKSGSWGTYEYTRVILESLGWKEVQTGLLFVKCSDESTTEEELSLVRAVAGGN